MRRRRAIVVFLVGTVLIALLAGAMPRIINENFASPSSAPNTSKSNELNQPSSLGNEKLALSVLNNLQVKGRAPKSGYERSLFGDGWAITNGCTTRDIILNRDLTMVVFEDECTVKSGILSDPYTGKNIIYSKENSSGVQIDHVVALSDAWQKGAQLLTASQRQQLANDPLELLAVDGPSNQQKSDSDAASWLPKNKSFRCEFIARQTAVKWKYNLWVTQPEKDAMLTVLNACPGQLLP